MLSRAQRLARSDAEDFAEIGRTSTGLVIRRDLGRISDKHLGRISGASRVYISSAPRVCISGVSRHAAVTTRRARARVRTTSISTRTRTRHAKGAPAQPGCIPGGSRAHLGPACPSPCASNAASGRVPRSCILHLARMQQVRLPGHHRGRQSRPGANRAPRRRERRGVADGLSRNVHTTRVGVGVGARRNNRRDRRDRAVS